PGEPPLLREDDPLRQPGAPPAVSSDPRRWAAGPGPRAGPAPPPSAANFPGFPDRGRYLALPASFFSAVLPEIADLAELKVTLHALPILLAKKGSPRYIFPSELLADAAVEASLRVLGEPAAVLAEGLRAAAARGV